MVAFWDTLAATISDFDSTEVIGRTQVDSIVRDRSLNLDMATPVDLGVALGAAKLLNVSISHVADADEIAFKGRLYDTASRRTVAEFAESCGAGGGAPVMLAKIMAWTFAPQLAPVMAPQRVALMRDSLRTALNAPMIAAATKLTADRRHRSMLDSLVHQRVGPYDAVMFPAAGLALGCAIGGLILGTQSGSEQDDAQERRDYYNDPQNERWAGQLEAIEKTEQQSQQYHRWSNVCYGCAAAAAVTATTCLVLRITGAHRVRATYRAQTHTLTLSYTVVSW